MSAVILYQSLSDTTHRRSWAPTMDKSIIPNVPRRRLKAPPNSSLSPIRSQKLPGKNRTPPSYLTPFAERSQVFPELPDVKPRRKSAPKVSFNEQVTVIHTVAHDQDDNQNSGDDSDSQEETPPPRRRSAGSVLDISRHHDDSGLNVARNLKRLVGKR